MLTAGATTTAWYATTSPRKQALPLSISCKDVLSVKKHLSIVCVEAEVFCRNAAYSVNGQRLIIHGIVTIVNVGTVPLYKNGLVFTYD